MRITNCGCGFIKLANTRIFVVFEFLLYIKVVESDLFCVEKACFKIDVPLKILFSFALRILLLGDRFNLYEVKVICEHLKRKFDK